MPSFLLIPHPDYPTSAASTVEVTVERADREILLRYELPDPVNVNWPRLQPPRRQDGLWRSTCFELFLMPVAGNRYREFNFSPSTSWAAYGFTSVRRNMAELVMRSLPTVRRLRAGVDVILPLSDWCKGEVRMGLSAVIEQVDGSKTYWALAHPHGPPDFHNPACFTAKLPPPPVA